MFLFFASRRRHTRGALVTGVQTCALPISGGMIIAAAEAIRTLGFDPARHMRVTAQDIDIACVQMTYLNCSFYDIPATIIHGNVLTLEERSSVRTPVLHALDGFDQSKAA